MLLTAGLTVLLIAVGMFVHFEVLRLCNEHLPRLDREPRPGADRGGRFQPQPATLAGRLSRRVDRRRFHPELPGRGSKRRVDCDGFRTGIVTTPGEADSAALDAQSVDGVGNVQNNLRAQVGEDF